MIRVLIAEDQALLREALVTLLDREPELEIVGEAADGEQAVAEALRLEPDVALLDLEMPGRDGLWAAAELHARLPGCRVLILTVFGRPGYLRRAIDAGAAGFLLKDVPPAELVDAIRRTAAGATVVDPKLAVSALSEGKSPLTEREREALVLSGRGASVDEIARQLHLTNGTVRSYLSIAIQKLEARNRFDAARLAEEKGWL